jgi:Tfp pilus assembly protein PilW
MSRGATKMKQIHRLSRFEPDLHQESGFSLVEFLLSTFILLCVASAVFAMLAQTQRAASYQSEVQAVMDNSRTAMDILERVIRQAANDPKTTGIVGLEITSPTQLRVRSDLTGSAAGGGYPDKGDPDGDTGDAGEDVLIGYNAANRAIELTPNGGSAQPIANYISAFSMQYFDAAGAATTVGANVRKVRVTLTASTTLRDPQTGQIFGMQQASDIQIVNRQ